jgi:CBS domain containing-hemolysin-like protein
LEEIVGEINDEYDEEVRAQIVEDNGSYLLDGMLAVRDLNRRFSLQVPVHVGYTTLAGFLMSETGQVPMLGQSVNYGGATFIIERIEGRRIRRVRMTLASDLTEEARKVGSIVPLFCVTLANALW